jgi:ABC-2 type transport system ATP-binding protein
MSMIKKQSPRVFSYAANKGPYLSILGAWFFLCLVEGMIIVLLVLHFVSGTQLQVLILMVFALFLILLFARLLLPLGTCHSVTETTLELCYGLEFRASIPLSSLLDAQPVQEKAPAFPFPRYDAEKKQISLVFSGQGQVLLRLKSARTFRLGPRRYTSVERLLLSVARRDAFLDALALAPREQSETLPARAESADQMVLEPVYGRPLRAQLAPVPEAAPVMVRTEHLARRYADYLAVDDLNLALRRGEIYGFLGPNGAGKSTTIKMLVGLLQPTSGRAWLAGHDVWRDSLPAKKVLGYVADRALLYDRLSGREFLAFLAQLRGLPHEHAAARIAELLDLLELTDQAEHPCGSYSFGMKRKLSLAGALLHQPPVLILDEPLNGLDPLSSRRLKNLFLRLATQGTTILLSTHDLATAESICHRVGIIQRGRLLVEGSSAELRKLAQAPDLESVFLALTTQAEEVRV